MRNITDYPKKFWQKVTLETVDNWFADKHATSGSQAKGRNLALNSFIKMISSARVNGSSDVFVKAICYAEKTKNKVYTLYIVVEIVAGIIKQCTCACPAGNGFEAACKHVSAVLYGVEHYRQTGKSLERISCTSKLQTWHVPNRN